MLVLPGQARIPARALGPRVARLPSCLSFHIRKVRQELLKLLDMKELRSEAGSLGLQAGVGAEKESTPALEAGGPLSPLIQLTELLFKVL